MPGIHVVGLPGILGAEVIAMKDALTVFSLDLAYLRSGYAVIRQPGDEVLKYGVIKAEPYRAKVTELVRMKRSKSAFDGLRLALYYADEDHGPLDALVYEEPQWVGAALRRGQMSKASVLALGMALERLYLVLAAVGWMRTEPKTGHNKVRPVYSIDPARWQPLFTGTQRLPAGQMKPLVRRYVKMRTGIALTEAEHDAADAIAIGIVASKLLQIEGTI